MDGCINVIFYLFYRSESRQEYTYLKVTLKGAPLLIMATKKKVAILGTRGFPSYYGGFETALRVLVPYLAKEGWCISVYGRKRHVNPSEEVDMKNITSVITKGIDRKTLSTLSYGATATLHILRNRPDIVLVMNVANGFFIPVLKIFGIKVVVNVDGIEWQRDKWNKLGKILFKLGAILTARFADQLIADSKEIARIWKKEFNRELVYLPYGSTKYFDLPPTHTFPINDYILFVARLVPENSIVPFLDAIEEIPNRNVVIVGREAQPGDYEKRITEMTRSKSNVHWLKHIENQSQLASLWKYCGLYFHGHTVGGTNPALVQAMSLSAPTLAVDTAFNREVLGALGTFTQNSPQEIANSINHFFTEHVEKRKLTKQIAERADQEFNWKSVCAGYQKTFNEVLGHPDLI